MLLIICRSSAGSAADVGDIAAGAGVVGLGAPGLAVVGSRASVGLEGSLW